MDGLECNEIMYSQLERTKRLDAEYYKKESLAIVHRMEELRGKPITKYVQVSDGNHMGISDHFATSGVPYYRGQDIHEFFIEDSAPICIDEKAYESLYMRRSYLHKGDVLVSIVGTIGEVSVVSKDEKATCNCKLAILRPNSLDNTSLIALYLRSKYGSDQIKKSKRGSVQMSYLLEDMNQILIPSFSQSFASAVEVAVTKVRILKDESNEKYNETEDYLLRQINVNTSSLSTDNISIKSFSESFGETGRLDAEYYQKKYDRYNQQVLNYAGGSTTPAQEFKLVKTKCTKELDEYPYVEIGDIDIGTGSAEYSLIPTDELPANAKIMTKAGDLLISTVRPYRGAVSILEQNDLLVSGAFTVLRETGKYPAQTLQVLFRTQLYKDWFMKFNVGTSYPVIKDNDILNIPIPVFGDDVHSEVRKRVQYSQALLSKSKVLLECAKKAVEMAIEQSEEEAMAWLNNTIPEIEASIRYSLNPTATASRGD